MPKDRVPHDHTIVPRAAIADVAADIPVFMTPAVARKHFGASERTLRRWASEGKIRGYRIAGTRSIRYRADEVLALLEPIPTVMDDPALNSGGPNA